MSITSAVLKYFRTPPGAARAQQGAEAGRREALLKDMEQQAETGAEQGIIGKFGVGFYSSYMVSDNVNVLSRDAENNEIVIEVCTYQLLHT